MFTRFKNVVFFALFILSIATLTPGQGHSLLQRNSPGSEFDCVLTRRELRRFSGGEDGHWVVTDSGLEALEGDIQTLVNCTEEGDVLFFDVEASVRPRSRITIPWNLTLSAFVESPRLENGTFLRARRKVTFLCPRANEGVFFVETNDSLLANFAFRNCSMNHKRGEAQYGIITAANCSSGQTSGSIAFHHLEFEANFLNGSAALHVRVSSCSSIQMINVTFQNNSCIGICAARFLSSRSEIWNITLTRNRFLDKNFRAPELIGIHLGSNATINGLTASGNDGTVVNAENASLSIVKSHIFHNVGGLTDYGFYPSGVLFLFSSGQIQDCRFEENTGSIGTSISVQTSSVVIQRTSVVGCSASLMGGGISITFLATVRILDSFIANNSGFLSAGGVYSNGTRYLQIENTIFEGNSAGRGGGLHNAYGDLEISNCTFRTNNAVRQGAGLLFYGGIFKMRDSGFTNNAAGANGGGGHIQNSSYSLTNLALIQNEADSGGGLAILESFGSLVDSYFAMNSASSAGGGLVMLVLNESIVHRCSFLNNIAENGGGIYGDVVQLASLFLCQFSRNRATDFGGGARLDLGTYVIEDNTFEENASNDAGGAFVCLHCTLNVNHTSFVNNSAITRGAGSIASGNTSAWFANCNWTGNVVHSREGEGGGAFFHFVPNGVITSSVFSLNQAQSGGAAYSTNSNISLLDVTCTDNTAKASGAVLYLTQSSGIVSNCSFTRNSAGWGGVFRLLRSAVSISFSSFVANEASNDGGAVLCGDSRLLAIEDSSFASNSANGYGGALAAAETVLSMRNNSLVSCTAVNGGGIYLERSLGSINETSVTFCKASESGGGIGMIESNVNSNGLNISFNSATGTLRYRPDGGGIAMGSSSTMHVRNVTLDGNRAQYGGGIYARGDCNVFVANGRFYNNSVRTSGGAAFVYDSSLTLLSVSCVRSNAIYGGSIYIKNSSLTLNNSRLINSSSTDSGGSILAKEGSNVTMKGTTIQSSRAVYGGGIMLTNSNLRGFRVQFQNCSAKMHGGGVGLNESSSFLCTNCMFEGNSALQEGGALRLESLSPQMLAFQLENTILQNNDAAFGGSIHFQSSDGSANCSSVNSTECTFLALTGCAFTNNHARFAGGAILANNPNTVRISCHPVDKADRFTYYTHEELGTFSKVSSLDVVCNNWTENTAVTYGSDVGSYARQVSTTIVFDQNKTEEMQSNEYALNNHRSGVALPTITLEAIDEFGQGPAVIQDNQLIEAVMTSPDGLFVGNVTVRMAESRGSFSGITPYKEPLNYTVQIKFSEGGMPTLIIVVEIRHCGIGEARTASSTVCELCGADGYNFHPLSEKQRCDPCPDDGKCDSRAIRPKKGFWHKTPCSSHVQRCLSERACDKEERDIRLLEIGSTIEDCDFDDEFIANYSEAVCREGYTGPLCGSCKASHGKTRSFRCEKCYGSFVSVCLFALIALVLLGLAAYTINGALPARQQPASTNQSGRGSSPSLPVSLQMVEMWCTGIVPRELIHPHLGTQGNGDNASDAQQQGQRNAELAKWKATEIFKITINYLQVIGIAIAVNVAWTGALLALFETAEFIGGVTSEAAGRSTDCLVSADSSIPRSAVSTIVNLIIPALVDAFLVVFWTVVMIRKKKGYGYLMKRCLLSILVVSYLSYIAITKTAVNTLYCIDVHDSIDFENESTTRYWAVDTALKCYDGSHTVLASVSGWPVLALFSIGFPIIIASVLIAKRNKDGAQSLWLFETAGFLYRCYDKKFIFWECVILFRKAILAVIVVFAYPLGGNLQGLLAVCVLMLALYVHLLCSPYRSEFEVLNRLEGLSLFISCLTFVSGLFLNDDRTSADARATITAFVVFASVGLFVYLIVSMLVSAITFIRVALDAEGVPYNHNGTAFHIFRVFLKNNLEKLLRLVLEWFGNLPCKCDKRSTEPEA